MPLEMAGWVADTVGGVWPLFAGVTGALGAFIAGSNTVSNLMFSAFQHGVAARLAMSSAMIVALQAVGAAATQDQGRKWASEGRRFSFNVTFRVPNRNKVNP